MIIQYNSFRPNKINSNYDQRAIQSFSPHTHAARRNCGSVTKLRDADGALAKWLLFANYFRCLAGFDPRMQFEDQCCRIRLLTEKKANGVLFASLSP